MKLRPMAVDGFEPITEPESAIVADVHAPDAGTLARDVFLALGLLLIVAMTFFLLAYA